MKKLLSLIVILITMLSVIQGQEIIKQTQGDITFYYKLDSVGNKVFVNEDGSDINTNVNFRQTQVWVDYDNGGLIGITTLDGKGYVVLDVAGDASELYQKTLFYVNDLMKNPEYSIVGNQENKFLKWNTHDNVSNKYSVEYSTSVTFKDGKLKVEYIISKVEWFYAMGGIWSNVTYNTGYYRLYKNENLTKIGKELKPLLVTYFDNKISLLEKSLNQELVDENW